MARSEQEPAGVSRFVRAWNRVLHGTGYVALTPSQREQLLTGLTQRLADAILADPPGPGSGYQVAVDLVAAGFNAPPALGRTVSLVTDRLASDLGLTVDSRLQARTTALIEALTVGFTQAVHDLALDEQEHVRVAALTAQARAEEALRRSEARYRHLATHDSLTGLPNLRLFTDRLRTELATGSARLAVCCLGLDRFDVITDTLGHKIGDRLLLAIADRLRALTSSAGHLLARLDSDQFAILLVGVAGTEAGVKVADRAQSLLTEPFRVNGNELPITVSAGVVERAAADSDAAELIRSAQAALHWAKEDGPGTIRLFHPERSMQDVARYRLSAAMPAALRRGEFLLHYQPLVDLANGSLRGFEALARWDHPGHGLLTASRFIGLAAHTGLLVPLGEELLEHACRQAVNWRNSAGEPPFLSFNLDVCQLRRPGLVGHVSQTLHCTGLAADRLQLEVTEDAMIDKGDQVTKTLAELVQLGVRIVVDDFGTGYSSLANLRDLPLHGLKLDAVFAEPSAGPDTGNDEAFLHTLATLGHTLGLTVTAEGIESADHARRMRAIGCDLGQGWHLGRPVPSEALPWLLRAS